jgi:hypothetical protein
VNPAVTDSFALRSAAPSESRPYPAIPGHEPDEAAAAKQAADVEASMDELRKLLPRVSTYFWETHFFQPNWQEAFWAKTTRGFLRSRTRKIPTAFSSFITASATKSGARTDS